MLKKSSAKLKRFAIKNNLVVKTFVDTDTYKLPLGIEIQFSYDTNNPLKLHRH